ncbi:hypothetical protein CP973_06990 [Streptomyces albofaciens JCM 4342]|uniref:hypothetical protein n=1 Tax=Streptomyces albofaciens TaxID=66866 RepID=UPI00123B8B59|nr:hypothetical protein [Streptomyces albofaciens]KAA6221742.1 hypothetical protein CP973_06990 [Streptomyces albofaciens JCM 4342]
MAEQQPTHAPDGEAEARVRRLQAEAAEAYAHHQDPATTAAARDQSAIARAHGNESGGNR